MSRGLCSSYEDLCWWLGDSVKENDIQDFGQVSPGDKVPDWQTGRDVLFAGHDAMDRVCCETVRCFS
jgi:hypothetical protein